MLHEVEREEQDSCKASHILTPRSRGFIEKLIIEDGCLLGCSTV
jgi:hypothetical protein